MDKRSCLFDNIKVILMFSVVIAHFMRVSGFFRTDSLAGFVYIVSFGFIMQGFLFVSGYFSKNVDKCRNNAVKTFLLPYVVMMVFMYFVRIAVFGHAHLDLTCPTMALWFLLVMFVYRFAAKDLIRVPYIVLIALALYFLSGCIPFLSDELALGRLASFLVFFTAGLKADRTHIDKIRSLPSPVLWLMLACLIVFSALDAHYRLIPVDMMHLKNDYSLYGMGPVEGMLVRLVLLAVASGWIIVIIGLTPDRRLPISRIGQYTMTIFLFHIPVRYIIKRVSIPFGGTVAGYLIVLLCALACMYLFSIPSVKKVYDKVMDTIYNVLALPYRKLRNRL